MAAEQLFTYVYMENADQRKYGGLMKKLKMDKSLKNNLFPKTFAAATTALEDHPFDEGWNKKQHNNNNNNNRTRDSEEDKEKEETLSLTFAQMQGKCWVCGKDGHRADQCSLRGEYQKKIGLSTR